MLPAPAPGSADAGVEAFHEDPNGVPDGKCYAGFPLAQPGGAKFTGTWPFSVAWSHEGFEALLKPAHETSSSRPAARLRTGRRTRRSGASAATPPRASTSCSRFEGTGDVWIAGVHDPELGRPEGQAALLGAGGVVKGAG